MVGGGVVGEWRGGEGKLRILRLSRMRKLLLKEEVRIHFARESKTRFPNALLIDTRTSGMRARRENSN